MPPQTLEARIESLEHRVTTLEELPARMDDLTLQVSQLRTEMRAEFSALRGEVSAVRHESREQGVAILTTLRQEIAEQGQRTDATISKMATGSEMRALYEDVISRIALLQEGLLPPHKPRSRKK